MHLLYVHLFVEDIYDMHNWHISLIGIRHIHTAYITTFFIIFDCIVATKILSVEYVRPTVRYGS